jgi:hypothetical protein
MFMPSSEENHFSEYFSSFFSATNIEFIFLYERTEIFPQTESEIDELWPFLCRVNFLMEKFKIFGSLGNHQVESFSSYTIYALRTSKM